MADREKLIELLLCVPSAEVIFGKREGKRYTTAWHIANHLIANGVTVRERGRWIPHYETFDADMAVGILGGNYQTGWQCSVCGRYEPSKEPYCNCGNDIRVKDKNGFVTHCECAIDGHRIGYIETFEGWCRRWKKDHTFDGRSEEDAGQRKAD